MAQPPLRRIFFNVTRDFNPTDTPGATTSGEGGATDEVVVAPAEIRAALDRVRKSATLVGSGKLVQFLSFIVETTLSGNARELKETIIGISVFGRPPDYDPKADTIVRSQAWRLRAKLTEYYQAEGSDDPVIIDLRKGSYIPAFLRRGPDHIQAGPVLRKTG